MINYSQISEDISTGLCDYYLHQTSAGILVVEENSGEPVPDKPCLTMSVKSIITEGRQGVEVIKDVPHPEPGWDFDVAYIRYDNFRVACSFNIYGEDNYQSVDLGILAQQFFLCDGLDYLKPRGIVVVECTALENRNTVSEDTWEYRYGFDAIFRVLGETSWTVPTIETINKESES